jgi:asparagine synthase (glutamine-hydrolysing)
MCGIAGQIFFNGKLVDKPRLENATKMLRSRGPDDEGYWFEPNAGVGHRRLSIQDLSLAGHQPMCSHDGRYIIVYNGEIYNFRELRLQLDAFCPKWNSDSDTEVILEAYARWGTDCVTRFQGMFALAIWDRSERVLFAARDRMGVKPFYYHHQAGQFSFASRPGALRQMCPGIAEIIDEQALRLYIESGYIPAPYFITKDIRKLPPAYYLIVDEKGMQLKRYWDFRQIEPEMSWEKRREHDLVDELDDLIDMSVRSRMISDAPLGAFLSGGIDSSLVVAMMQKHSSSPVKTFTIGFDESYYDESSHAHAVADYLGTDHHCEQMKVDDLLGLLPLFSREFDEPFFDSSAFPVMAVSRLARQHVAVSLSGDGADELFGGYHYYRIAQSLTHFFKLPDTLRRTIAWGLGQVPQHRLQLLAGALRQHDVSSAFSFSRSIAKDYGTVLLSEVQAHTRSFDDVCSEEAVNFAAGLHAAEQGMRLDACYTLPDEYLQKVDVASMAFSLESREPLLDHKLVEWSMKLPLKWKLRAGTNKYLLSKLAYRYLPRTILDRPKQGFCVPINEWLKGPLKGWASERIHERRLFEILPLDQTRVIDLFDLHKSGSRNVHPLLWAVLMLLDYFDSSM